MFEEYRDLASFLSSFEFYSRILPEEATLRALFLSAWEYKGFANEEHYLLGKKDAPIFTEFWNEEIDFFAKHDEKKYLYTGMLFKLLNNDAQIEWNNEISSFSKSPDFSYIEKYGLGVSNDDKYSFLYLNTFDSYGLDLDTYRNLPFIAINPIIRSEKEILFPMSKRNLIKIYRNLSVSEFLEIYKKAESY